MVIRRARIGIVVFAFIFGLYSANGFAQDFDDLSEGQQELLTPLAEVWDRIPAQRRARIAEMASRMEDKSPEEQARFQNGLGRFVDMETDQRRQVRALFDRFSRLPPGERQRVVERVSTMSEAERGAFALGMRIADRTNRITGGLDQFFRSLPMEERRQLIDELEPLSGPEKLRRLADELEAHGYAGP